MWSVRPRSRAVFLDFHETLEREVKAFYGTSISRLNSGIVYTGDLGAGGFFLAASQTKAAYWLLRGGSSAAASSATF